MKIHLAPMEGLADHYLREIISNCGDYDLVFTEFVRVIDHLLPKSTFLNKAPELLNGARTKNGTPIRVQLLGSNPEMLALNAVKAIELGSHGVDLNFGCPSKTVNKSRGGAVLLKEPETIYQIVRSVRSAVATQHLVTVKMRLGFEDDSLMWECADAIANAGADELTVHARTKSQGYTPPAYWHLVKDFRKRLKIPIIINGEIWTNEDARKALEQSDCEHLMIGRGAIRQPMLANHIRQNKDVTVLWETNLRLIESFWAEISDKMPERYCAGRLKQWLNYLKVDHTEAADLFTNVRKLTTVEDISDVLTNERRRID